LGWAALFVVVPNYGETGIGAAEEPVASVLVATAHQALGAVLLGLSFLAAAWSFRLTAAHARSQTPATMPGAPSLA
jgi:hypothetical protein